MPLAARRDFVAPGELRALDAARLPVTLAAVAERCDPDGLENFVYELEAPELREELESRGAIFQSSVDTEVIVHMLADGRYREQPDPLSAVLRDLRGSYCLLLL